LHNIGLYIYIVKYKSGIKYPIFSGKKEEEELHLSHVLKIEMDIMTGL